jgi:hypothetical protein
MIEILSGSEYEQQEFKDFRLKHTSIAILNQLPDQIGLKALHSNKPILNLISDCYISQVEFHRRSFNRSSNFQLVINQGSKVARKPNVPLYYLFFLLFWHFCELGHYPQ